MIFISFDYLVWGVPSRQGNFAKVAQKKSEIDKSEMMMKVKIED